MQSYRENSFIQGPSEPREGRPQLWVLVQARIPPTQCSELLTVGCLWSCGWLIWRSFSPHWQKGVERATRLLSDVSMKCLKPCVGGKELFRFSSAFGELCPILHYILEKSVQAFVLVSLYSKKSRWISDLDWKMWDECFLRIIQTRCGLEFKAEKMVFKLNLKCVCVCSLIIFRQKKLS